MADDASKMLHIIKYASATITVRSYEDLCEYALSSVKSSCSSNMQLTINKTGKINLSVTCDFTGALAPLAPGVYAELGVSANIPNGNGQHSVIIKNNSSTFKYIDSILNQVYSQLASTHGITLQIPDLVHLISINVTIKGKPKPVYTTPTPE